MGRTRSVCYAASLIALAFAPPVGASEEKLSKQELAAIAMSPEQVAAIADVQNDPLDMFVRIDTEPFLRAQTGLFSAATGDKYVRSFIHKKTGEVRFQIYLWTQYTGDWEFFDRVNYETPDGPVSSDARRVGQRVLGCGRYGCLKQEDVAFEVPEALLRTIAADAKAGDGQQWQFRIYGKITGGQTTGILKTEIAGALIATDREKARMQK